MKSPIQRLIHGLKKYTDRPWYPPVLGIVAGLDAFLVVIPTDGLMVSYVLMHPKRWIQSGFFLALGSAVGSTFLAAGIERHGVSFIEGISPGITSTGMWQTLEQFMTHYGEITLWLVSVSPLFQHPAVALAALTHMPLLHLFVLVITARLTKYLFMAWVASHAPERLGNLWGIQSELKEVQEEEKQSG